MTSRTVAGYVSGTQDAVLSRPTASARCCACGGRSAAFLLPKILFGLCKTVDVYDTRRYLCGGKVLHAHCDAKRSVKGLPKPDYISLTGTADHDLSALRPLFTQWTTLLPPGAGAEVLEVLTFAKELQDVYARGSLLAAQVGVRMAQRPYWK